jgi:hypothetical protein
MIQGIAAALMSLAEFHGIRGTCFVFSSWIGGGLERRDVERVVRDLGDILMGVQVKTDQVLKGWRIALGSSNADKLSIYL